MFEINTLKDDRIGVKVVGEVDISTAGAFRAPIEKIIQGDAKEIYMDLTELQYIDSTGIGILIELRKASMTKNQEIILVNPQKNISKLLELTGVDQIFKIKEESYYE